MFLCEIPSFVMFIPEGSVTSRRVCKPWAQNGLLELRKTGDKTLHRLHSQQQGEMER